MKVLTLGAGACLATDLHNSSFLVTSDAGTCILFDCGYDTKAQLEANSLTPDDIDCVYVSHVHMDHCASLEWLAYMRMFKTKRDDRLKLYAHPTVLHQLEKTFAQSLCVTQGNGGVSFGQIFDIPSMHALSEAFRIDEGMVLYPLLIDHVRTVDETPGIKNGAAVFDDNGKTLTITGDFTTNGFTQQQKKFKDVFSSDLILCDCEMYEDEHGRPLYSNVHPHFKILSQSLLTVEQRGRTYLYHYDDVVTGDWDAWRQRVSEAGFAGFALEGETLEL